MKRNVLSLLVVMLATIMVFSLIGCSVEDSLVGEYIWGSDEAYLRLNADGTCIYSESDETGTGTGTWYVEDDMLYVDVSNLSYSVYADVSQFYGGFLLQANSGLWNDGYFHKIT